MKHVKVEFIHPFTGEVEEFTGTVHEICWEIDKKMLTFGTVEYRIVEDIALIGVLNDVSEGK